MSTSYEARVPYSINENTSVSNKSEMRILESMADNAVVQTGETGVPAETGETFQELLEASDLSEDSLAIIQRIVGDSLDTVRNSLHRPLVPVIQGHYELLVTLAQSWVAMGVEAFTIWDDGLLFCWPQPMWSKVEESEKKIRWSPIKIEKQVVGKIGIIGSDTLFCPALPARMAAESALLAKLVTLTNDLANAQCELVSRERLKMEMDVAASIQSRLLSQTFSHVRGLDIFARSLPARQVGGDFYCLHAREQRPFVFAAGDVSGKGLPAALLMAMTRIVLDGAARFMPDVHPKALLNRVNEDLYDDFTELGMFVTIFTGCYDPDNRQLSYANAGHAPVIYCPAGGAATLLEADGPAAGVLPFNLCENFTLSFQPGDILVVATDGFNEAVHASGEMFGYERLLTLVEKLAHLSAESIATWVYEQVQQFTDGCEQSDDQTLVILKGVKG